MKSSALKQFRIVALVEGVSFLLLLFVGVPLKHKFGIPIVSRVFGTIHGGLTLFYLITLMRTASECGWPLKRWTLALLASVIPFGAFVFDASVKRELQATPSTN